jgi:hypothetical protein
MDHERYKELAALAAGGLLSGAEDRDLRSHLEVCASCRRDLTEYQDMLFKQFPFADSSIGSQPNIKNGQGYKTRFLERARAEGIGMPEEAVAAESLWRRVRQLLPPSPALAYGAAVVLAVLCGVLGFRLQDAQEKQLVRTREIQLLEDRSVALQKANAGLEKRVEDLAKGNGLTVQVEKRLSGAKEDYAALSVRYAAMEGELKAATERAAALSADSQIKNGREQTLSAKLKETEASLAAMSDELQNLRKTQATDAAVLTERAAQVRELEVQLAGMNDSMERVKKLFTADRDIRDLMGARNLHITDVYDVDSKGKTKQPFGRVFYTENRSLIFYAFDLNKQKNASTNRSFQVWGYQEAAVRSIQSLGVLFQDDQKQNRWVLKFNDPAVLAEIDAVFVTAEPAGGSNKPTGQKLLYAYLGSNPNHP